MAYYREMLQGPIGYLFVAIFGVGTIGGIAALTEIACRLPGS